MEVPWADKAIHTHTTMLDDSVCLPIFFIGKNSQTDVTVWPQLYLCAANSTSPALVLLIPKFSVRSAPTSRHRISHNIPQYSHTLREQCFTDPGSPFLQEKFLLLSWFLLPVTSLFSSLPYSVESSLFVILSLLLCGFPSLYSLPLFLFRSSSSYIHLPLLLCGPLQHSPSFSW